MAPRGPAASFASRRIFGGNRRFLSIAQLAKNVFSSGSLDPLAGIGH